MASRQTKVVLAVLFSSFNLYRLHLQSRSSSLSFWTVPQRHTQQQDGPMSQVLPNSRLNQCSQCSPMVGWTNVPSASQLNHIDKTNQHTLDLNLSVMFLFYFTLCWTVAMSRQSLEGLVCVFCGLNIAILATL